MITRVSATSPSCPFKDPRRKAQSVQFKNKLNLTYDEASKALYKEQKRNAMLTSIYIVAGSIAFTIGYFFVNTFNFKNLKQMV